MKARVLNMVLPLLLLVVLLLLPTAGLSPNLTRLLFITFIWTITSIAWNLVGGFAGSLRKRQFGAKLEMEQHDGVTSSGSLRRSGAAMMCWNRPAEPNPDTNSFSSARVEQRESYDFLEAWHFVRFGGSALGAGSGGQLGLIRRAAEWKRGGAQQSRQIQFYVYRQ